MNIYDYISIILGLLIILSFFILVVRGKRIVSNRTKFILIGLVSIFVLSIILLNHYYNEVFLSEIKKVNDIETQMQYRTNDSLLFTLEEKQKIIDSLQQRENELNEILSRIQKQEKIIGNKTDVIDNIEQLKQKNNNEIYRIKTYNEIIANSTFDKCRKGLTYSGETSLFTFQPPLNTDGEYLDFIIKFHDNSIIDKIAVIYISVYKQHNDGNITQIYSQYYKPQAGINAFRLKNYFSQKDIQATFGFFWKNDFGKNDFPRYEKITYPLK